MNDLVIKILDYIDNNLYSKISIDELSRLYSYNKDYIMRTFKRELNLTIIDYINKKRVYNSLDKLKETNDSILKISILYGFSSIEYYSETFNKLLGVNPHTFRKFTKNDSSITYKDIELIRKNITSLKYQLEQITKYSRNTPSKNTIKKLSIFK